MTADRVSGGPGLEADAKAEAIRVSAAALSENGWEASERAGHYVVNALEKSGLLVERSALEAVEAERDRLREIAIEHGGCYCTWDVVGEDGVDHGHDVIVRPDLHCPVHAALSPADKGDA